MIKVQTINSTLEIAGPRGLAWRPTSDTIYLHAQQLVASSFELALKAAEDAHIEKFGHMRDVKFRIKTITEQYTGMGSVEQLLGQPTAEKD